ncbi:hypothetical protein [Streptomyces sp. NPDC055287]
MEAFGNDPVPVNGASLPGAYWLDAPPHADDDCVWCAELWQDSAPGPHASAAVESAVSNNAYESAASVPSVDGWVADLARMVMLSVAACTVVSAMLVVALA